MEGKNDYYRCKTRRQHALRQLLFVSFLCVLILLMNACKHKPLLSDFSVSPETITPNADGETDLTKIEFMLNANATVSIVLIDTQDNVYTFRSPSKLSVSERPYTVLFSGVVDGFLAQDETINGFHVLKRTLPDGTYTWKIVAEAQNGESASAEGTLLIKDSDTTLPGIYGLTVFPKTFSPNQDGIADRTTINLTLDKDVEILRVYLQGNEGIEHQIADSENLTNYEKGWHTYDYDGGIDAGSVPPPDGTYIVYATAQDRVGQRTITSDTLTILDAGLPRAYIVNGDVQYSTTSLVLSDTLCFTLTVENDSDTHLRTAGPWPGTIYQSDENFNAQGYAEESGAFRVGMDFDTSLRNYPFRWGIGRPNVELVQIDEYWYLPPRARSQITGCVQINEIPVRNPLYYWMGLIHEDVEIAPVNNHVDPHFVTIWEP